MSDLTNGKGGVVDVTGTAQLIELAPPVTQGTMQKTAMTVKVWNTGASTVYAVVNVGVVGDYTEAQAVPIPAGESFWFVGQPMKNLVLACTGSETSTANYGAY
jgi:hypothetical protein